MKLFQAETQLKVKLFAGLQHFQTNTVILSGCRTHLGLGLGGIGFSESCNLEGRILLIQYIIYFVLLSRGYRNWKSGITISQESIISSFDIN